MLSKTQIKQIAQLSQKKSREQQKLFVAEGLKLIQSLCNSDYELQHLYTTQKLSFANECKQQFISESDLKKISRLTTPQTAVATFRIPKKQDIKTHDWVVVLDQVRDPGNLGTIIRLCDWFGVETLVCSEDSVDCYNPKVVQATMGSLARVTVHYTNLQSFLKAQPNPIYGTFTEGKSLYESSFPDRGVLVLGNEANGISKDIAALCNFKTSILRHGRSKAESLNVAMATAVFLSEIRRPTER